MPKADSEKIWHGNLERITGREVRAEAGSAIPLCCGDVRRASGEPPRLDIGIAPHTVRA